MKLASFYVNSFNRLPLLKNLLKSFELCNRYERVEWIITDYGSTDGSREFIQEYARQSSWPVKYLMGDESEYLSEIRKQNIRIDSRWTRFMAIIAKFRNDARQLSSGDYIFDVGSDHQFIRPGNWVEEVFEIYKHRENEIGFDDIACLVHYGYPRWRLDKPNNARGEEKNTGSVPYYVAKEKAYVDYNVMKKNTIKKVGNFSEPQNLKEGTRLREMWDSENDFINPEVEYERRCNKLGLKRIFMKYPILVSFPNSFKVSTEERKDDLFAPLWTLEEMKKKFGCLKRPVSSEELGVVVKAGLVDRCIGLFRRCK